jgi:endonuclease/exonuclease/phosphatase family metal-dependent hydrolase
MLRVMTYNIATGGVDDDLTNRLPLIHAVVRAARPDVLAVQEASEFELRWQRRMFAFERATACDVLRTPETDRASDHYPVVADFDLEVEAVADWPQTGLPPRPPGAF